MKIGRILKKWRAIEDLTLRELGQEIGISAASMMRLEQGRETDAATFLKVMLWLGREEQVNAKKD